MDDAERTLIIILASALAVLLILSIIALIKLLKLLNNLKQLAEQAKHVVDAAESIKDAIPKALSSLAVGRILSKVVKNVVNKQSGKRKSKGGE